MEQHRGDLGHTPGLQLSPSSPYPEVVTGTRTGKGGVYDVMHVLLFTGVAIFCLVRCHTRNAVVRQYQVVGA